MIAVAYAQEESGSSFWVQLLPLVLIVVLFYFMLIRPQQKRTRQHREMLGALEPGHEVVTNGGILGKVIAIHDNFVTLDVGGHEIIFQKQSIQNLLPKKTIEGI